LSYTISVGGSKVDSRSTTRLNTSLLTSNLKVTGPNKVKYSVITNTESAAFVTASRVSSLYVNSFVSHEDIQKMEAKIALAWKEQYNSKTQINISFRITSTVICTYQLFVTRHFMVDMVISSIRSMI
jgi:hypothetical protein